MYFLPKYESFALTPTHHWARLNTHLFALFVQPSLVLTGCHFIPIIWWRENVHSGEGLGVVGVVYSISCVLYDSQNTTAKHAAAAITMAQQTHHDKLVFGGLFGQPMPIATNLPIGHKLPYWLMCGNWHRLAEMAAKRHHHKQQCKAARRHPISLVDNIKI